MYLKSIKRSTRRGIRRKKKGVQLWSIECVIFTYFLSRSIFVSHSRTRRSFFSATCLSKNRTTWNLRCYAKSNWPRSTLYLSFWRSCGEYERNAWVGLKAISLWVSNWADILGVNDVVDCARWWRDVLMNVFKSFSIGFLDQKRKTQLNYSSRKRSYSVRILIACAEVLF